MVQESQMLAAKDRMGNYTQDKMMSDNRPYLGDAICSNCKHGWTVFAPEGIEDHDFIECPKCHQIDGKFIR